MIRFLTGMLGGVAIGTGVHLLSWPERPAPPPPPPAPVEVPFVANQWLETRCPPPSTDPELAALQVDVHALEDELDEVTGGVTPFPDDTPAHWRPDGAEAWLDQVLPESATIEALLCEEYPCVAVLHSEDSLYELDLDLTIVRSSAGTYYALLGPKETDDRRTRYRVRAEVSIQRDLP